MKKTSILPILLTACVMLTTSCLGDTEEVNLSGYDDAAIIAFSLGTLNQYTYTKDDDGEETLSKTTYNGANYKFYIDQDKGEIYNPDSLPYGTDAAHVICIATSKNSGYITMRAIDSEDMVSYSSSDSIDFTSPRIFYVTSLNSERQRQYTVKVNVHQQESDKFYWNQRTTNAELSTMTDLRALVCGTKLFVFGAQQGEGAIYTSSLPEGTAWQRLNTNIGTQLPADLAHRVVTDGTSMYMLHDGGIWRSEDGISWNKTSDTNISTLLGATADALYAISSSGTLTRSDDEGQTWNEETLDQSATLLPTQDACMMTSTLSTNANVQRLLLIGHRDAAVYSTDSWAQTWSQIIDPDAAQPWMYYSLSDSKNKLPMLTNLQVIPYDSGLLAIGGTGQGASTAKALSQIYYSPDCGVTWMSDERYEWPKSMSATEAAIATDSDHFVWLICSGSGQIWRGRLTQLGWEKVQTAFTE